MAFNFKTILFKYVIPLTPIIALIGSATLWWDSRYMHKEMSNARYIDQQIRVVQIELDVFYRFIDSGATLTAKQQSRFDALKMEENNLKSERQKQLGIGDLPQ